MMKRKIIFNTINLIVVPIVVSLVVQSFYFFSVFKNLSTSSSENFDAVLTYSDPSPMDPSLFLALSRRKPLYVSQAPGEGNPFRKSSSKDLKEVTFDPSASTTDQNARRASEFVRKGGYRRIVLDVGWFHVPRALFLTRFYLMGSGVKVIPCSETSLPSRWWAQPLFWIEVFKFWGSLCRIALHWVGVDHWPPSRWFF